MRGIVFGAVLVFAMSGPALARHGGHGGEGGEGGHESEHSQGEHHHHQPHDERIQGGHS